MSDRVYARAHDAAFASTAELRAQDGTRAAADRVAAERVLYCDRERAWYATTCRTLVIVGGPTNADPQGTVYRSLGRVLPEGGES